MAKYRDPKTAPRDGTIIVGLFEPAFGKRRISARAAYDTETKVPPDGAPQWLKDESERQRAAVEADPVLGFSAIDDSGPEVGRMVGWRPLRRALADANTGKGERG